MENKAYIVVNEQQESEVLKKLEQQELVWFTGIKPTEQIPSSNSFVEFPYVLFDADSVAYGKMSELEDEEIVFDGRKEEQMKISKEVYDALVEWKDTIIRHSDSRVFIGDIKSLPGVVQDWIYMEYNEDDEYVVKTSATEINSRLVDVIRWIEDDKVFEVEKPKKWVVRSKDRNDVGEHRYLRVTYTFSIYHAEAVSDVYATKFDTKEEAESWANSHQEVIEVEEY